MGKERGSEVHRKYFKLLEFLVNLEFKHFDFIKFNSLNDPKEFGKFSYNNHR